MIDEDDLSEDRKIFKSFLKRINSSNTLNRSINRVFKILNNFDDESIYRVTKAKAKVGEIREWKTGKFKKISEGQWVKVPEEGEKPESGGEIVDDLPEQVKQNITLNPKQEAYLKEKLDKLKFFSIAGMEKHEHTKAILDAVKEENPDLEISDANKTEVIQKMTDLIKGLLQKKLDEISGVTDAKESPETASNDDLMALAKKKSEYTDKADAVFLKNPTKDPALKKLQEKVINEAIEKGNWALADGMISSIQNHINAKESAMAQSAEKPTENTPEVKPEAPKEQATSESTHPSNVDVGSLKLEKTLGGSTGAQLFSDDKGNKYVVKAGKSPLHVENEYNANSLYASVGLEIPDVALRIIDGNQKQVAKHIDGVTLGEYLLKASSEDKVKMKKKIQEGFVYDAILANWDVIGLARDNVLVSKDGKPYRIDNGGSINYRAQGGIKKLNGGLPQELTSMRSSAINPSSSMIFGTMSDNDVADHILKEVDSGNMEKFKKALASSSIPFNTQDVLMSRIDATVNWAKDHKAKQTPPVPSPVPQSHSIPKFKSDMNKHMFTISQWSKQNLLSSTKISDFVQYAQNHAKVDFSNMEKNEIVNTLKTVWNDLSTVNVGSSNFVLKSQASDQRGFVSPLSVLNEHYAKVPIHKISTDYANKTYSMSSKKDAENAIKEYDGKVPHALSSAISKYTGSGYTTMNNILRGLVSQEVIDKNPNTLQAIANADAYLRSAPKYVGDTYRGVKKGVFFDDMMKSLNSGEPYEMQGFSSSATVPDKAWTTGSKWDDKVLLKIKSKTGVYVDPVSSNKGEDEVLHNTHMKYKVVDYKKMEIGDYIPDHPNTKTQHGHMFVLEEI